VRNQRNDQRTNKFGSQHQHSTEGPNKQPWLLQTLRTVMEFFPALAYSNLATPDQNLQAPFSNHASHVEVSDGQRCVYLTGEAALVIPCTCRTRAHLCDSDEIKM